jgi:hypothetical protein
MFVSVGDSVQRPQRGRSTESSFPVRWAVSGCRATCVFNPRLHHCFRPDSLVEPPGCLRSSGTRTFVFQRPVWVAGDAYPDSTESHVNNFLRLHDHLITKSLIIGRI